MTAGVRTEVFRQGPEHAYPAFLAEGKGACADLPPDLADLFTLDARTVAQKRSVDRAALLCQVCPFKLRCREWAIEHHPQDGIYGGTTQWQREGIIARERGSRAQRNQ